jgi:hypothetical protein
MTVRLSSQLKGAAGGEEIVAGDRSDGFPGWGESFLLTWVDGVAGFLAKVRPGLG